MSSMETVLSELPEDIRPSATLLWRRAERVTDEATETLLYAYKVLGAVPGDADLLQDCSDMLRTNVAGELSEVVTELDACRSQVDNAWLGAGSDAFRSYMPQLTQSISDLQQSAGDAAEAVSGFRDGMVLLWDRLITRVDRTADEVRLAISAAGGDFTEAAIQVIAIVDDFAGYVEELAESLMDLRCEDHTFGRVLHRAGEPIEALVPSGDGYRLPMPSDLARDAGGWEPAHSNVWYDTRAMAGLTAMLSDSGRRWQAAADSGALVEERFTPEAFGLAGVDFQPRLSVLLQRDVSVFETAGDDMERLADTLRRIGYAWVTADDAVAEELGHGIDED